LIFNYLAEKGSASKGYKDDPVPKCLKIQGTTVYLQLDKRGKHLELFSGGKTQEDVHALWQFLFIYSILSMYVDDNNCSKYYITLTIFLISQTYTVG